jgi:hypothetical protein
MADRRAGKPVTLSVWVGTPVPGIGMKRNTCSDDRFSRPPRFAGLRSIPLLPHGLRCGLRSAARFTRFSRPLFHFEATAPSFVTASDVPGYIHSPLTGLKGGREPHVEDGAAVECDFGF